MAKSGHHPYRFDEAVKAGVPQEIAAAARLSVDAQKALSDDPSEESAAAFAEAQNALRDARVAERAGRPETTVGGDASANGEGE